ncbi:MAG: type II CRISPR-associated endonuclease Cas1 [Alphaproteobacteria bacterium]|nr:type II CRISPR-associated endonuclease Cas1 [Alphaproteobacteria bacterium]
MAWRGVHVTNKARLSLADGQMVVEQADGAVRLPLEDIGWVVVDTPQATVTLALLTACMAAGVAVVVTDARHTPSGVMLPFHGHYRQGAVAAMQAAVSVPLRKRLWQAVVRRKVENQAAALAQCGGDGRAVAAMAGLVASGDAANVEARAAREYWGRLFPSFRREDGTDKRNMLLNYGYAVVRSAVARGLVAAGLLPAFGIGHASASNAFNLADDMVEPLRPLVDVAVWRMSDGGRARDGEPDIGERRALAALPLGSARMGRETMSVLAATEAMAESLVRAMEGKRVGALVLPLFADAS